MKVALVLAVAFALAVLGPVVRACSVPVFRYALERWERDLYEVTVLHRGPLAPKDAASLRAFAAHSAEPVSDTGLRILPDGSERTERLANVRIRTVDLSSEHAGDVERLWQSQGTPELPWMTLQYPRSFGVDTALWAGPLGERAVASLLDSPARREIARRILGGECAVWVLLECGNTEKDEAAATFLEAELSELESALDLPMLDPWDFGAEDEEGLPQLRVAFSVVRVERTGPEEAILREMLLRSEEGLASLDEPMAFPVFGRGRVLCALAGKGINEENVLEICAFLVGPCSCVVKAENPGVDLLTSVDWDGVLQGRLAIDEHLPPLVGFSGFGDQAGRPGEEDEEPLTDSRGEGSSALVRSTALALAAGVILVLVSTILILRRERGQRREP